MKLRISEKEMKERLQRARENFLSLDAEGVLISDSANVRYLSGFTGSEAALLLTRRRNFLFTDSRYVTQAETEAVLYRVVRVTQKLKEMARKVRSLGLRRLCYEAEGMTHARFLELRRELGGVRLINVSGELKNLRARKSATEVALICRAAGIARRAFMETVKKVRPGMRERELALLLEQRMRELGSGPAPFPTIVASGRRGALPHGTASDKKLRRGEMVTVDFGAVFQGYQADQTETFCLGPAGSRQRLIYETVREAGNRAMAAIRPGISAREVDAVARRYIKEKGFGRFFGHGLGHGVGLLTHEEPFLNPRSKTRLEEGMVVTVEPGIYIPGFGGGRIEDMVLVARHGYRRLTRSGGPLREL